MSRISFLVFVLSGGLIAACSGNPPSPDAGDAGSDAVSPRPDSSSPDSHSVPDAASDGSDSGVDVVIVTDANDGSAGDAHAADTGAGDTGAMDSGAGDTGAADSGAMDTGAGETGAADTGAADTTAADTGAADATEAAVQICGDGVIEAPEACDDGNTTSGDGCSAICTIEPWFVCPTPDAPCRSTVMCGDGLVQGTEQCDDHNTTSGDGCSSTCQVEPGWQCPYAGARCIAAMCGDGIVAGNEPCDTGTMTDVGCSAACQVEHGWACVTQGNPPMSACHPTVCGDGVVEGYEECDDGNLIPYDGCSPTCTVDAHCPGGGCTAVCGDGIKSPQEACDDGNRTNGDGCSSTCTNETGWTCPVTNQAPPSPLVIPILYRDMLYAGTVSPGMGHPDFNSFACGVTTGLVSSNLGLDSEPVFGPNGTSCMTNAVDFCWWFHETGCGGAGSANPFDRLVYLDPASNPTTLTLNEMSPNVFQFGSTAFFPIDTLGWNAGPGAQTDTDCSGTPGRNFAFTSELHDPFTYQASASPTITFTGNDDVWVFVNGLLAIDLGGVHGPATASATLDAPTAASLGLMDGSTYSIDLFQAQRHVCGSAYTLTLTGFTRTTTLCSSVCGDGVVVGNEVCDDGTNNGAYGGCQPGCLARGPFCGDGMVQSPEEQCDDGSNLVTYGGTTQQCGPGCRFAPYCGDGVVSNGEQCDGGPNCNAMCQLVMP